MSRILKTIALSLLAALPLAASALDRTELLPPSAQTYVRISDTTTFWNKLKVSSIGKLWQDQQFQDFLGNPDNETWQELFFDGEMDAEDEVMLEQLKMLSGEVILAFDLKSEEPYIIAAMSQEDFIRSLDLDEKLKDSSEQPFEIIKSSFQDVEIIQHIENGGTPEEEKSWQANIGNTLILGYTREWIEQSIVRLKKETPKEPEGNPEFNINVPVSSLIKTSMEDDGAAASQLALFEALGIFDITTFSSTIVLKDDRLEADNRLVISDLARGLFTLLDLQPSELPTVTFIPENIASLEVGRFNLLRFWQEIPSLLSSASPEMKPQFDMILGMIQQQAGINLEQDLLSNLGTKYIAFATVEDNNQISVVAVDLKDGAAFKKSFETALAAPAMQSYVAMGLESLDFLDHTLYTIKNNDPETPIAFTITADYLLYGHPNGLRQTLRSITSEAAENQAFERTELVKGLRQNITPRAFSYNAVDWKKNMDAIIKEFNRPEYTSIILQKWATSGSALPPPDFSKLPSSNHIAEFFNVSYQYIEANSSGLHQKIILKY
ncbi:MAG: hypothetical protein OES84_02175 [Kiritimatiellaceae bacterium]|nr:hypothetical protein [Kiritimatiellaceae bacterium]